MKAKPVPKEFSAFQEAVGKLLTVSKEEVDRRAKAAKKDPKGRYSELKKA
jgi:hypothetical protein